MDSTEAPASLRELPQAASLRRCDATVCHHVLHMLLLLRPLSKPLPAGIKATTRDGVLMVTVPKTEERKPKSIDVSVE